MFPLGDRPNYEQSRSESVAGLAEAKSVSPWEMMYDLLLRGEGKELFYQPLGSFHGYSFDYSQRVMQIPEALFGLSDGGAHCGIIADAGMPSYVMSFRGRDRDRGEKLPLEFLVRKLSRDTAEVYGMDDRGLLRLVRINTLFQHPEKYRHPWELPNPLFSLASSPS